VAIGVDRVLVAERRPDRHVDTFEPGPGAPRIGAKPVRSDSILQRRIEIGRAFAQRHAERLFDAHRRRQRQRAAPAQDFLERRQAELGLVGELLSRHAPARDFLTNKRRDLAALLAGKFLLRRQCLPPRIRKTLKRNRFRTETIGALIFLWSFRKTGLHFSGSC